MRLKEFFDLDDDQLDQMLEIMDTPEFQRWFRERQNEEPILMPDGEED
jgi:hypothetical protein